MTGTAYRPIEPAPEVYNAKAPGPSIPGITMRIAGPQKAERATAPLTANISAVLTRLTKGLALWISLTSGLFGGKALVNFSGGFNRP